MLRRKRPVLQCRKRLLGWALGKCLGLTGEGGVERTHRKCNVQKETVIVIHHPYELL